MTSSARRPRPVPIVLAAGLAAALAATGCTAGEAGTPSAAAARRDPSPVATATPTFGTRDAWARRGEPTMGRFDRVEAPDAADRAGLRGTATRLLVRAAGSDNALLRANALEALTTEPERLLPAVRLGLGDANRGVRFVATMMVGRERLEPLVPLVQPLLDDRSGSVRAAAIYALARCGRPVDLSPLGTMLLEGTIEERGNAALVLGRLGDASAADMLRSGYGMRLPAVTRNSIRAVELQIAEAAFRLDRQASDLEIVRAALFSGEGEEELAALACQMLGEIRDEGSLRTLAYIATRDAPPVPAEVRMAAATAVARMRPDDAPIQPLLAHVGSDAPALRAQAAAGLGWARSRESLPTLATLLEDRSALVQVAAAGAILRATAPPTRMAGADD